MLNIEIVDVAEVEPGYENAIVVNRYPCTLERMKDIQNIYAGFRRRNYAGLTVLAVLCGFCAYHEYAPRFAIAVTFAGIGVFCILAMIFLLFLTGKEKQQAIQDFSDRYGSEGCELKIILEEAQVYSFENETPKVDAAKSEIRETIESEQFYIFKMADEELVPMAKDAFQKGDLEACKLYTKPPKKKWFQI